MQPLTAKEIKRLCKFVFAIAEKAGLSISPSYNVVFVSSKELKELLKKRSTIEVEEGVYIDPKGLVIVRDDFLANVAIRKVMVGVLSLAVIESFGSINKELVDILVNEHYDRILANLYSYSLE